MSDQIVKTEGTVIIERTPQIIAAEIRSIDSQAREYVLRSAVEIGKRLYEAKDLVAHGEWGDWLKLNVSYSQSSANNFMRISEEYADSQTFGNLSYSQAVALLALPGDQREAFAEENDMESMSTRELQAAIKAQQELERQLKESQEKEQIALQAHEKAVQEKKEMERLSKEQGDRIRQLNGDLEKAQASGDNKETAKAKAELRKAEKALSESQLKLADLESEVDQKVQEREEALNAEMDEKLRMRQQEMEDQVKQREEVAAKQISDMQEQLRKNNNVAGIKVKLHFETLVGNFKSLLAAVDEIGNDEQQKALKGRIAVLCDEIKAGL